MERNFATTIKSIPWARATWNSSVYPMHFPVAFHLLPSATKHRCPWATEKASEGSMNQRSPRSLVRFMRTAHAGCARSMTNVDGSTARAKSTKCR